jgi:hypothetical protein
MADLAPRGATHRPHFTSREWREVVVQHERLRRLAALLDRVEALHVVRRTERHRDERLRLSAREQRRSVRARQEARVDRDRAHLVRLAPIDTPLRREDLSAQLVILDVTKQRVQLLRGIGEITQELLGNFLLHALHGFDPRVLVLLIERLGDLAFSELFDARFHALGERRLGPLHLRRTLGLAEQLVLQSNQLADPTLRDRERLHDVGLTHLERPTFDHHDRVL